MSIQNARSNTSGRLPTAIPNDGQLFIQQADDILFTRKPNGSFRQFVLPKRANVVDTSYTVNRWDTYIGISTLTAPHTLTLPAASAYPVGHPLTIVDESGACSMSNQITIVPNGTDTINGAVSLPQNSANFGVILFSDGVSKWTFAQFSGSAGLTAAVAAAQAAQTAAQNAQTAAQSAVATLGQCRLEYVSTTQLNLNRRNGRLIFINGSAQTIPAGGVPLTNTGLTQATLYYVYAYMSGSVMALEAVTTAYAADTTYGGMIKSGDATRTLVGMIYTDTGTPGLFADTAAKRYVASWFNRRQRQVTGATVSGSVGTSTAEVNSGGRAFFLAWGDVVTNFGVQGYSQPVNLASFAYQLISDGSVVANATLIGQGSNGVNYTDNIATRASRVVTEGLHWMNISASYSNPGNVTYTMEGSVDV